MPPGADPVPPQTPASPAAPPPPPPRRPTRVVVQAARKGEVKDDAVEAAEGLQVAKQRAQLRERRGAVRVLRQRVVGRRQLRQQRAWLAPGGRWGGARGG
jgi:hypothetical protein